MEGRPFSILFSILLLACFCFLSAIYSVGSTHTYIYITLKMDGNRSLFSSSCFSVFFFLIVVYIHPRMKFDEEQQQQLKCFILPLALGSFKSL